MQKLMDVNYTGTYHATRAALPVFRRQGRGHVIIVSSIVGKRGVPYMGAYSATKFAQVGLAECLRAEVAGSDIHVSVVYPVSTRHGIHGRHGAGDRDRRQPIARTRDRQPNRWPTRLPARSPTRFPRSIRSRRSRGLVLLNAIAPGFCDRVVRKFGRQPVRAAERGRGPASNE